jgi:hypothetical protein
VAVDSVDTLAVPLASNFPFAKLSSYASVTWQLSHSADAWSLS